MDSASVPMTGRRLVGNFVNLWISQSAAALGGQHLFGGDADSDIRVVRSDYIEGQGFTWAKLMILGTHKLIH